jgi:hypothetical protein
MKFSKTLFAALMLLAVVILALPARAQTMDTFAAPRSIVLAPPRILDASAAKFTNGPVDVRGYIGTASVDITSVTNAGGALTASFYTSNDQTNLTALTNFAAILASTSYSYTNRIYGGTNVWATNPWLLPGTLTTPAGSSLFAGQYLDPTTTPFTNATTITVTAKGVYRVGLRAPDLGSYLYIVWTPTGSSSNDIVSAVFNGIRQSEVTTGQ